MKRDINAIASRIKKLEGVESVKIPLNMPSFFGFKERGLFEGYDLIIITDFESNDFIQIHGKKLRKLNLDYTPISYYSIGILIK